jgi:hypothetical protein
MDILVQGCSTVEELVRDALHGHPNAKHAVVITFDAAEMMVYSKADRAQLALAGAQLLQLSTKR